MRDEGRRVKHSEEKLMYSTGDYRVTGVSVCVCVSTGHAQQMRR